MRGDEGYRIVKDKCSLVIKELFLDVVNKSDKLILEGHTLPCLHSDGFCKPTLKYPNTIVWFPEEICLDIHISVSMGWRSKLKNRYWFETDHFLKKLEKTPKNLIKSYCQLHFFIPIYHCELELQFYQDWKTSHQKRIFCIKNQHKCMQLTILICLSLIFIVLLWTLETIIVGDYSSFTLTVDVFVNSFSLCNK